VLESLKQILSTGIIDHVEEYDWKGRTYLRVFMIQQKDYAWDGPKTAEVLKLINHAHEPEWQRKKKGTR
jgi:hypothetical protein